MTTKEIMKQNPLPSYLGGEHNVIGYEAYRSVGTRMLRSDTLEGLTTEITKNAVYPPYEIVLVVGATKGTFSITVGFNSPDGDLIYHPKRWEYHPDIDDEGDSTLPPTNSITTDRFKDWYLKMKLGEFISD